MLVLCASWVRGSGKLDWLHGLGKLNGTIGLQELSLGAEIKQAGELPPRFHIFSFQI